MARAGDRSLHREWIRGERRNFDLYLSCYGSDPARHRGDCEHWRAKGSTKWPALAEHLAEDAALVGDYEAVWMPDDDILTSTEDICRMFDLFSAFRLDLAQPALSANSYHSHAILIRSPGRVIRYLNFVEVMAPILSSRALAVLSPTFPLSSTGWGLDFLWPQILERDIPGHRMGVIDATPVVHTRPVGAGDIYATAGKSAASRDLARLASQYPWADLSSRGRGSALRLAGHVSEAALPSFLALSLAWMSRKLAKWRYAGHPKHPLG